MWTTFTQRREIDRLNQPTDYLSCSPSQVHVLVLVVAVPT